MLCVSLALCALSIQGQISGLPHIDFAADEGGWTSVSANGKVSVSREVVRGKTTGSLRFDYSIAPGQMDAIVLQTAHMPLGKMRSLRFWIRPDHDTTFGVFLQETEGGRYVAVASARKDAWQLVELAPSDFILSDGEEDPADPNGKLDMSFVDSIGLTDFKQMIAQAGEELVKLFGVKVGAHTLFLSEFMASTTGLREAPRKTSTEAAVDTFERPQPSWVCAGQTMLSVSREGPSIGAALRIEYSVGPGAIAAVLRSVAPGTLTDMERLEFSLASEQACSLIVQLEERGGGKYNTVLEMKGSPAPVDFVLPFDEFEPSQDSKDGNEKLDLGEVKQILLLDPMGLLQSGSEKDNTIWLGPVFARAGK